MTDPRAALAEDLMTVYPFDSDTAHIVIEDLAERGVMLVTEERLAAAFVTAGWQDLAEQEAAAIFAALSALEKGSSES